MSRRGWAAAALLVGAGVLAFALFERPDPAPPEFQEPPAPSGEVARSVEPRAGEPAAGEDVRCRCAPLDLADYWAMADEVALARLAAVEEIETDQVRVFRMVLEVPPWKTDRPSSSGPLAAGDTVEYRTAVSTATCGVQPELEAVYAVFGRRVEGDVIPTIDICSGTRVHRSASGSGEPGGFRDVPGRFLVRQLDALGGLAALEGLAPLPDPADSTADVLRGLLDLEPLTHGGGVRILQRPDPASTILATLEDHDAVMTREVGYEVAAAVVFGRIDGWSRVRLADGRTGWVAPDEAGTWFPYADLPVRRLAYLTPAWSGHVWPDAGAGIPVRVERVSGHAREQPVEVLESSMIGGLPWFRVSVLGGSPCEGSEEARHLAGGWVPGYGVRPDSAGARPTVWYWSRGC